MRHDVGKPTAGVATPIIPIPKVFENSKFMPQDNIRHDADIPTAGVATPIMLHNADIDSGRRDVYLPYSVTIPIEGNTIFGKNCQ